MRNVQLNVAEAEAPRDVVEVEVSEINGDRQEVEAEATPDTEEVAAVIEVEVMTDLNVVGAPDVEVRKKMV